MWGAFVVYVLLLSTAAVGRDGLFVGVVCVLNEEWGSRILSLQVSHVYCCE